MGDEVQLALMVACVVVGLVVGLLAAHETFRPPQQYVEQVQEDAYGRGYDNGFAEAMNQFNDTAKDVFGSGDARFLFRQDNGFNRSLAVVYPDRDLSFECTVSRRTINETGGGEWVIARQTFKYNGTVSCQTVGENLIPEYSSSDVNDTLLRNTVTDG